MTTNNISKAWDIINRNEQDALWRAGNNDGLGFDPTGQFLGNLVLPTSSAEIVAVFASDRGIFAVGDANGPWAVQIG